MEGNLTRLTEQFISEHPSIKDCVRLGLVNYSALSRLIIAERGVSVERFHAVLIACRRYFAKVRRQSLHEGQVTALVKKARLTIRNRIVVAIIEKPKDFERVYLLQAEIRRQKEPFSLIEGEEVITIITSRTFMPEIRETFKGKLKKVREDLVQISMIFDPKIEVTSGVVNYIYSLLAENGINVLEEMSCWTDVMFVLDEKDLSRTVEVLHL